MDGAIGIEGRIKAHTGTHAALLDLAELVDARRYGIPCQQHLCAIGQRIDPTFVDGMGNAIGVDGCAA